ncbi:PrgI family protein [Flavobacterium foetidum]|uniref:PrgI family protein n=1 Tax=Flavobacterium foetidum TaxID=2026681 RepID=UPI00107578DF|nr:PrgI family protein [Flavobacterium foetidum]KAF2507272.1 PrgI family protein [Flavobacterium foetidum]
MENLNFIDPLLHGINPINNNQLNLSAKQLACAGVGSLIAAAVLKKTGHTKSSAFVGSLALPLLASALYKKYAANAKEKRDANSTSGIEYNH